MLVYDHYTHCNHSEPSGYTAPVYSDPSIHTTANMHIPRQQSEAVSEWRQRWENLAGQCLSMYKIQYAFNHIHTNIEPETVNNADLIALHLIAKTKVWRDAVFISSVFLTMSDKNPCGSIRSDDSPGLCIRGYVQHTLSPRHLKKM